ncbi:MAG: hypothetical protein H6997_07135 [Moraxellaceae bacterium]|nr:hypothetical protein [Pseudomonadales bacterium]MCP5177321.1 hypothetical protein [Moraxellaceae bacterium]
MDWNQVLGYAAKAADMFKKAVDNLATERDLHLPESVLNTALATVASRSQHLQALSFELYDNWFNVDLVYLHQGIELNLRASFDVENMTLDHHKQTLILRERRPIEFKISRFKSTWQQLGFNVWAWWLKNFKKTTPLIYMLHKIEGMSVKDGIYRMDFSHYIRRKPAFVATLYALDIKQIKILDKEIYIRGSADLKSLNLLNELYKLLPNQDKTDDKNLNPSTNSASAISNKPLSEEEADVIIDNILATKEKE